MTSVLVRLRPAAASCVARACSSAAASAAASTAHRASDGGPTARVRTPPAAGRPPLRQPFLLFDKPHFMLRPMEPSRRMYTWLTLQVYRTMAEPQFTHSDFCHAAAGFAVLIANSIADNQMGKLRYVLEDDLQKAVAGRLSVMGQAERDLLRVDDTDVMYDMLAQATWNLENFKNIASRRLLHINYISYLWRGGKEDFESATGTRFESAVDLIGSRRLARQYWHRVLIANLQFSRVLYPELGDWKVTLLNYFEPPMNTSTRYMNMW